MSRLNYILTRFVKLLIHICGFEINGRGLSFTAIALDRDGTTIDVFVTTPDVQIDLVTIGFLYFFAVIKTRIHNFSNMAIISLNVLRAVFLNLLMIFAGS